MSFKVFRDNDGNGENAGRHDRFVANEPFGGEKRTRFVLGDITNSIVSHNIFAEKVGPWLETVENKPMVALTEVREISEPPEDSSQFYSAMEPTPSHTREDLAMETSFSPPEPQANANVVQHHSDVVVDVTPYSRDIHLYLVAELLPIYSPLDYMGRQVEINIEMRTILVDWLVDVRQEFSLHAECLFLATNYIDRFLSRRSVHKRHLQLLGTSALMLAAKYEEITPPHLYKFVFVTDNSYRADQVASMERKIFCELEFRLSPPTSYMFLRRFVLFLNCGSRTKQLAEYLLLLTLYEYAYINYKAHHIAAAALCFARKLIGVDEKEIWPESCVQQFEIAYTDIEPIGSKLYLSINDAPYVEQKAAFDQYNSEDHYFVSTAFIPPVEQPSPFSK